MTDWIVTATRRVGLWLINDDEMNGQLTEAEAKEIDWFRMVPYLVIHLACFAVFWVGFSWVAFLAALGLYLVRMFFITGFYHRYFSHRAFKTSRWFQFLMGALGCTAGQRGPLWWAGHHRHHHGHSDEPPDHHSPRWYGFLWSHTLWFMSKENFAVPRRYIPDLSRYRELVWVDRLDWVPFILFGLAVYSFGVVLGAFWPWLGTNGWQMLVWGFFVSTVLLYHGTYTINSLAHQFGRRRFETGDDSRNNFWLALLTLGEGWHNNHHYYPSSARQGFYWWEIDVTYYILLLMGKIGLVREIRPVPGKVLERSLAS